MHNFDRIRYFVASFVGKQSGLTEIFTKKHRQRLLIFIVFITLSFIFWFIRALNETYEARISYPVKYTKLPEDKLVVGELPKKLTLTVEALGLKIFMHQLHLNINALRFNVESFALNETHRNSFYVLTRDIRENLEEDLDNIRILKISPDTLFFNFADLITRKMDVRVVFENPENLLARQYLLNGRIYTIPDTVSATGPAPVLDTMRHIYAEAVDLQNLTDSVEKSVTLMPVPQVSFDRQKVRVVIPVDKFTETTVEVPVVPSEVPDSLVMKVFPGTVNITYRIALSNYDKVKPEMFVPTVNFNETERLADGRLPVMLADTPLYVHRIRIDPGNVDYIVERNAENWADRWNRQR